MNMTKMKIAIKKKETIPMKKEDPEADRRTDLCRTARFHVYHYFHRSISGYPGFRKALCGMPGFHNRSAHSALDLYL